MTVTRKQLKQATHTRVIDAAAALFQVRGFSDTSVRAIAESSGVSIGTVISVGDKNALLVRVFDTMIAEEHAARADHGITSLHPEAATCADRLSALVAPFVSLFTANPDLARSYASILVSGTHSSALFTDLAARLIEEFRGRSHRTVAPRQVTPQNVQGPSTSCTSTPSSPGPPETPPMRLT